MNPDESFLQDVHSYNYLEFHLEVVLDRFREDNRDGLVAEATITTSRQPNPGLLYHGRLNLVSARSRQDIVRTLERRNGGVDFLSDIDFAAILEQVSYSSLKRWREGQPTIKLADVEPRASGTKYLLHPFLENGAACVLFGDGGNAKSTIALAMGVSIATGLDLLNATPHKLDNSVLYLDWEADEFIHASRLKAIAKAMQVDPPDNLLYRHQSNSLMEAASTIRKEIAAHGVNLVICDSLGLAAGDEPEAAKTKIAFFNALRSFNTTALVIDHVSKADPTKPYGSVYTRNIARLIWGVDKAQTESESRLTVALRNEKTNHGRRHKPVAFHLDYAEDASGDLETITFSPADYDSIIEFSQSHPLWMQIRDILKAEDHILNSVGAMGAMTVADISNALEERGTKVRDQNIRTTIDRKPDQFEKTKIGNVDFWTLKPQPTNQEQEANEVVSSL